MGGFNPISLFSTVPAVLNTGAQLASSFGLIDSRQEQQQELALRQLQEQQALQQQQLESEAALERERIAANAEIAEQERRSALRRAVARQRAQFGGSGLSATGGSSEAVLLGLFDESQEELAARERLDSLRNTALDLDISNRRSLNLLQLQQLRQRQNFENELLGFSFF